MGQVWRGVDDVLGRTVAIKVLRSEYADSEEFRTRFRAEARAAAAVNHRNVVEVYDYGEQGEADGCLAYLVMEYVDGPSVADRLDETSVLDPRSVADLLAQTAAGLQAAHERGLVHRDIKPANLLSAADGTVKIVDFGIARAADAVALTRTGTVIGTAQYLAPEQAAGHTATAASDLYSLGAVGYACLAGSPPFADGSELSIAMAHLNREPPGLPADAPAELRELIMQLLVKDPAGRPSAAEVVRRAEQLRTAAVTRPATAPVVSRAVEPTPTRVMPTGELEAAAVASRDPRRGVLTSVAVVALIALVWGIASAFGGLGVSLPAGALVPRLVGKQLPAVRDQLRAEHLKLSVHRVNAPNADANLVLRQSPGPGTRLAIGGIVTLRVATGDVAVDPKTYVGKPAAKVLSALRRLGLAPSRIEVASPLPQGTVIAVSPAGAVRVGSPITVTVAGPVVSVLPPGKAKKVQPPGHGHGHGPGHGEGDG
jgi:serine/threonine-protein kinase